MGQYYFIHSALPELKIGYLPGISFSELMQLFYDNLSALDISKVHSLLRIIDLTNVYYYLADQPLDSRGLWAPSEIEESLIELTRFPDYLISFLTRYTEDGERMQHFSEVYLDYFQVESVNSSRFVRKYIEFERNLRLYLAMNRAKKLGREHISPISDDENTYDQFADLEISLLQVKGSPLEEYEIIQQYRINFLKDMSIVKAFGIDGLLAYMMQLLIIEDDNALHEIQGQQTIDKLLEASA